MQSQIQITVSAGTLINLRPKGPKARGPAAKRGQKSDTATAEAPQIAIEDLPAFARDTFGFTGMNIPTSLLRGKTLSDLEKLRDRADKAHCPFLALVDSQPIGFAADPNAAIDRVSRLAKAGIRLGCGDFAIVVDGVVDDASMEATALAAKRALGEIERQEITMLIQPATGFTGDSKRLCDLIKLIGGFRIGAMPSFAHAAKGGELESTLKRLAPYARCIEASVTGFARSGEHKGWDLAAAARVVMKVGYEGTLCVDYQGATNVQKGVETARQMLMDAVSGEDGSDETDLDDPDIEKPDGPGPESGGAGAEGESELGEEPEGNGD